MSDSTDAIAAEIAALDDPRRDPKGRFAGQEAPGAESEETDAADEAALEGDDAGDGEPPSPPEGDADGEDGEDGEDAGDDEDQDAEPSYTVIVDGQEKEVPLSELVKGYQQEASYTQKSQRLAEDRRVFAQVAQETLVEREAYTQLLGQVHGYLTAQAPPEEAINQLMLQDPVEGFRLRALREQIVGEAAKFADAYAQMRVGASERARAEHLTEMQAAMAALPELIPEWKKDPQLMTKEAAEVGAYMTRAGFSQEELAQITDPRAMVLARKAMKYDALMAARGAKPKPVQPAPRTLAPGSKGQPSAQKASRARAATDQARKTGRLDDVARAILADF